MDNSAGDSAITFWSRKFIIWCTDSRKDALVDSSGNVNIGTSNTPLAVLQQTHDSANNGEGTLKIGG